MFTPAPLPPDERRRSDAARASGLMNRIADPALSQVADHIRHVMAMRWCGITLIVNETMYVIASSGGLLGMYRRSTSLCSYVVSDPDRVFVVLDAPNDERFAGNPSVDNGLVTFFAGAAVRDRDGHAIGALCITDDAPRASFSQDEAMMLREFAHDIADSHIP
jgi:GAF domain-containing protein